jgi:predicted secreted Zn-dependent protease
MPLFERTATTLSGNTAAPKQFCAIVGGLLCCAFRSRAVGRVIAVAALMAAAHAPAVSRSAELASLDPAAVKRVHPLPEPLVRETYDTYDVQGASLPELRAGLRQSGIRMKDGSTYDALTSWAVRWEYDYESSSAGCTVDDFRVYVDVTIRYPRWVSDDEAPAPLADAWDSYLHSLIRHEQGHRDLAVAAADAMTRSISKLPPAATCSELDRSVDALGRSFMKRLSLEQLAYDADTDHGAAQGAVLP